MIEFALNFKGQDADDHQLDLYDAAQAMLGFQRSLAITTHLVMNGEVITQAPSLKNARIYSIPPQEGSWEIVAMIGIGMAGVYKIGTAPKDTLLGHLIYSAYDYIISNTMGFHVDYDKTLGQAYKNMKLEGENRFPILEQSKLDSATEKCETAIGEMHRPIVKSGTAESAQIIHITDQRRKAFGHGLDADTFEHIRHTIQDNETSELSGRVSSYNVNTHKGRIFLPDERRPIPFELENEARSFSDIRKITNSLGINAINRSDSDADVSIAAYKLRSKSGQLKALKVVEVL